MMAIFNKAEVSAWHEVLSRIQPQPHQILVSRGKPYRTQVGNKKLCVFPRSRLRVTQKTATNVGEVWDVWTDGYEMAVRSDSDNVIHLVAGLNAGARPRWQAAEDPYEARQVVIKQYEANLVRKSAVKTALQRIAFAPTYTRHHPEDTQAIVAAAAPHNPGFLIGILPGCPGYARYPSARAANSGASHPPSDVFNRTLG